MTVSVLLEGCLSIIIDSLLQSNSVASFGTVYDWVSCNLQSHYQLVSHYFLTRTLIMIIDSSSMITHSKEQMFTDFLIVKKLQSVSLNNAHNFYFIVECNH